VTVDELKFDAQGLIPAVVQEAETGEVLMVAWMDRAALEATLTTGLTHFWSRSRQALWRKGETSGHVQRVVEVRIDCDQDAVWIKVEQAGGAACHTGRRSCFYRAIPLGWPAGGVRLEFRDADKLFDPQVVYRNKS
jgi:phosphoribosyl-AMP cyclohydrolase